MTEPLVSLVIPTYNRAHCLTKAIDSVLAQTHRELEILVVDDGSTDGTADRLARAYAHEPRLRVLSQPNRGVSAARNHGLRAARGDFVALLDSDDAWLPWKLEAQLACLAAVPEAGMTWTDMDAVGPSGEILSRRFLRRMDGAYRWLDRDELFEASRPLSEIAPALAESLGHPTLYIGDIFSEMVLGNLVHTSTVLLRRERLERIGGFDETLLRTGEDYDFHLRTCREGPVAYLDVPSVLSLGGAPDQLTHGADHGLQTAKNFLRTISSVIERDRDRIRLPRVMLDEVLAEAHSWVGIHHVERGDHLDGLHHLALSLRHKPGQPRVLGFLALGLLPLPVANGFQQLYRRSRATPAGQRGKDARG
jgi:GT2 family glycosyltransferase